MKTKSNRACPPARRGSALLLTTILLFVVLSLVVSLSYVTVMEQQMSSKTKSSVGSFFNADSGVEWALNKIANTTGTTISSVFTGFAAGGKIPCPTGFGCELYLLDEQGKVITSTTNPTTGSPRNISEVKAVRSVGTQTTGDPTQRAIEAAVAGNGDYQNTCWTNGAFARCCKMNTRNGRTDCKYYESGAGWQLYPSGPWDAGASGDYQITCFLLGSFDRCCRTNTSTGATSCKFLESNVWQDFIPDPWP